MKRIFQNNIPARFTCWVMAMGSVYLMACTETSMKDYEANVDTDEDGFSDAWEAAHGTDPNDPHSFPKLFYDSDGDGVADHLEDLYGTNPGDANDFPPPDIMGIDTDGDGWPDSLEFLYGTNPGDGADYPRFELEERITGTYDDPDYPNADDFSGFWEPNTTTAGSPWDRTTDFENFLMATLDDWGISRSVDMCVSPKFTAGWANDTNGFEMDELQTRASLDPEDDDQRYYFEPAAGTDASASNMVIDDDRLYIHDEADEIYLEGRFKVGSGVMIIDPEGDDDNCIFIYGFQKSRLCKKVSASSCGSGYYETLTDGTPGYINDFTLNGILRDPYPEEDFPFIKTGDAATSRLDCDVCGS